MFVENKSVVLDACESERNAPVSGFCVEEEWVSDSHEEEGARLGGWDGEREQGSYEIERKTDQAEEHRRACVLLILPAARPKGMPTMSTFDSDGMGWGKRGKRVPPADLPRSPGRVAAPESTWRAAVQGHSVPPTAVSPATEALALLLLPRLRPAPVAGPRAGAAKLEVRTPGSSSESTAR